MANSLLRQGVANPASADLCRSAEAVLDLHHLRYVLVTAEEGSFHRASSRLKVAPSALSRRIQDIEEELDIALFERLSDGVKLSYAGRIFIPYLQRIFAEVEATASHFRRLGRGQTDVLRIAMNDIAPQLPFVPALLRAFREQYPQTELRLVSLRSAEQLAALQEGRIDAGILYARPEADERLAFLRLASHRFVLALPAGHRLAETANIKLADLTEEDFILFAESSGPMIHGLVLHNCRQCGLEPRIVQETYAEHMQLGLVAAKMGVSLVNESVTQRHNRPDLVFKGVDDLVVREHMDLTWRRDATFPGLASFVALAGTHAANSSPADENSLVPPGL